MARALSLQLAARLASGRLVGGALCSASLRCMLFMVSRQCTYTRTSRLSSTPSFCGIRSGLCTTAAVSAEAAWTHAAAAGAHVIEPGREDADLRVLHHLGGREQPELHLMAACRAVLSDCVGARKQLTSSSAAHILRGVSVTA